MTIGNHTLPTELLRNCTDGILYCFGDWAYEVTNGLFWVMAILGFSVAIIMATQQLGGSRSFAFGSFVGMILSIWLAIIGFMSWWIASAFILTGVVGLIVLVLMEK